MACGILYIEQRNYELRCQWLLSCVTWGPHSSARQLYTVFNAAKVVFITFIIQTFQKYLLYSAHKYRPHSFRRFVIETEQLRHVWLHQITHPGEDACLVQGYSWNVCVSNNEYWLFFFRNKLRNCRWILHFKWNAAYKCRWPKRITRRGMEETIKYSHCDISHYTFFVLSVGSDVLELPTHNWNNRYPSGHWKAPLKRGTVECIPRRHFVCLRNIP